MSINDLLELDRLAKEDAGRYPKKREKYLTIVSHAGKHFVGIVGPRGVGKTVLLKQIASEEEHSFYISLDTLGSDDIYEVVRDINGMYSIKLFLLDEIHFQTGYQKKLKRIFDFLNVRIIFSSSVSLSMYESTHDLSRRVVLEHLHPFSFKEYLYFKMDVQLPALTFDDILKISGIEEHLRYEFAFEKYLQGGLFPFSLEEPDVKPILQNILNTIIHKDIPMIARLHTDEISTIEKTVKFIGRSKVDGINFSTISNNIGISKYKAEQYVQLLEKAFILNPVFPSGSNVLKEPKILMYLPYRLLFKDFTESIGALREDFFTQMLLMNNIHFTYLKSKRGAKTPDYLLNLDSGRIIVEVGGKGKGREQFKGVELDKKLILSHGGAAEGIKRPLFLVGFIYAFC
jgi:predicted AAA+ superfamily ATPase